MAANPLVIPEGFGKAAITFNCTGTTREASITFGFTDLTSQDPSTQALAIEDLWVEAFPLDSLSTDYSIHGVDLTVTRGGLPVVGNHVQVQVGTAAFASSTLAVSMLCRKVTALGGRQGRGRSYLPGGYIGETVTSANGAIDSAVIAATTGRIETFRASLASGGYDMVLLHHGFIRDPGSPAPAMIANPLADTPTPVTSMFCEATVATQRRRQRG